MPNPKPPTLINFENQRYILEQYELYKNGSQEVNPELVAFFQGVEFAEGGKGNAPTDLRIRNLIEAYMRKGHIKSESNPLRPPAEVLTLEELGFSEGELGEVFPTLGLLDKAEAPLKEILNRLETIYCKTISFEYGHVVNKKLFEWLHQEVLRGLKTASQEERCFVVQEIYQAKAFEEFLQKKFTGAKRFSLEGGEAFMPLIKEIFTLAALSGCQEGVIGMAHRGRLNVLCNLLGKPLSLVFAEFMGKLEPLKTTHMGDVKYHNGYENQVKLRSSQSMRILLASNPSHLESVDPVMLGLTQARQREVGGVNKVVPVMVHGDASIAGQGVVYETMQLSKLAGYSIGGTIHIVINNQIGFTASAEETRSTRYCTDIAKTFGSPVIHVSAEDPMACFRAARLAFEIRNRFQEDVFIDLNCHRFYGHNEADEPRFTNPKLYKLIQERNPIYQEFARKVNDQAFIEQMEKSTQERLNTAFEEADKVKPKREEDEVVKEGSIPKINEEKLFSYAKAITNIPSDFHPHAKIAKLFEVRREALLNKGKVEWAAAELLAYASLVDDNFQVRLSGQDCRRGTFSHRHAVIIDQTHDKPYAPLAHVREGQGLFEVYNSALSEYAVMGYEFGFTLGAKKALVIWEAQFGDFVNGAQIIIDQYLSGSETKWNQKSNLTLFLPHGHEGMGPEHTSSRIERFLQLSADNNWSVAYPSTPAQFFHLLRRQALRKDKKPLILATPKSMLRLSDSFSDFSELVDKGFEPIILDKTSPKQVKKLLLCTGKIYYELLAKKPDNVAIIRVEELYPFPEEALKRAIDSYTARQETIWVQEEPENQGAWSYIAPKLLKLTQVKYVGRKGNPVPDTGYAHLFKEEQERIIREAMS